MSAVLRPAALTPTGVDADLLRDPYPVYSSWREAAPLHWSERFFGGAWLVTRHADVEAILRNDQDYSARRTGGWVMGCADERRGRCADERRAQLLPFQSLFSRAMLFLDAPDHARLRSVLNAAFRGPLFADVQTFIEQWLDARLPALVEAREFDFIAEIARPLPAAVIGHLLGLSPADETRFVAWSEPLARFIGAANPDLAEVREAQEALLAMTDYFAEVVALRRRAPGEDLVSALLAAEREGRIVSDVELLSQCAMLLFAGYETTRNLLGNGLNALLSDPCHWSQLRQAPELLPAAVRELLRFDSPVQWTGRRVKRTLQMHGQVLQRGELVLALIGSANRDPRKFRLPDLLDFQRPPAPVLSFGAGAHACLGARLTLLEAQTVFGALLNRCRSLTGLNRAPAWNGNAVYRGLSRLPMAVEPAS